MHPRVPEKHFDKISDFLNQLEHFKQVKKTVFPRLRIYNVITSLNTGHLQGMLDFAIRHHADHM